MSHFLFGLILGFLSGAPIGYFIGVQLNKVKRVVLSPLQQV